MSGRTMSKINILFKGKIIPRRKSHFIKGEFLLFLKSLFDKSSFPSENISEFEDKFASFIKVECAVAVSSGRKGMELILRALNLQPEDEVIIPAYTLGSLVDIIKSLGLVPVPADIDIKTFNMDPASVNKRISGKTRAILATHLFGTPCKIDEIIDIAKDKSIYVIEDCAHSAGSKFKNKYTGAFGDISFFSFEVIKPLNTYGGGMVVTNNKKLAEEVRRLSCQSNTEATVCFKKIYTAFFESYFLSTFLSFPFLYLLSSRKFNKVIYKIYRRMQNTSKARKPFTGFQAYLGLCKLATLEQRIRKRQELANHFKSLLSADIAPQGIEFDSTPNYYFFVARLPSNTDLVRRKLLKQGIDAGIGSEIADDCGAALNHQDCPKARQVFMQTIQLPLYEGLSIDDIEYLSNKLKSVLQ